MSRVETQQSAARAVVQAPAQEAPQKQGISARWKSFRNRVGNWKTIRHKWQKPEDRSIWIVNFIIWIIASYWGWRLWMEKQYAFLTITQVATYQS